VSRPVPGGQEAVDFGGPSRKSRLRNIGFFLVILSCVLYAGLLAVPFIPLDTGGKVAVSAALVALGEAAFWIGGVILGRELVVKYRQHLNPLRWFRRRNP